MAEVRTLKGINERLRHPVNLASQYLLYVGPINSTAINRLDSQGKQVAYDQHSVTFKRGDKPDIDFWEEGTLKVYCPSILPAFPPGKNLEKLNDLLNSAEKLLFQSVPLLDAVRQTASRVDYEYFINCLNGYVERNLGTPDLSQRALVQNYQAYDRSIILQSIFMEENRDNQLDRRPIPEQAVYAFARQKAIFVAMAPHYAVEAIFDDQFAGFPYHLPDFVNKTISDNSPVGSVNCFDRPTYERGLHHDLFKAPSPDMYRFIPILASLIAPVVMKDSTSFHHYDGWVDFREKVINRIENQETIKAFKLFAKGMGIPLEFAYFAAFKMCQKEVRKRGPTHLFKPEEALTRAHQTAEGFEQDLDYYQKHQPYLKFDYYEQTEGGLRDNSGRLITKNRFNLYTRALRDRAAIDHVNSVIGTYKFIPWVQDDSNFSGIYLPYAVMKSEKARLVNSLRDPGFAPYWQPKGVWFRDCLPQLIATHPSMYSKWFYPLLEKGMVDEGIIEVASAKAEDYLRLLLIWENNKDPKNIFVPLNS